MTTSTDTADTAPTARHHADCVAENNGHSIALDFVLRDGRVHGFPYAYLLNYLLEKNESGSGNGADDAPPERLSIWFSTHDVMVTGWRLDALRHLLRAGRIATVTARDPRYSNLDTKKPFVGEIVVNKVAKDRE